MAEPTPSRWRASPIRFRAGRVSSTPPPGAVHAGHVAIDPVAADEDHAAAEGGFDGREDVVTVDEQRAAVQGRGERFQ